MADWDELDATRFDARGWRETLRGLAHLTTELPDDQDIAAKLERLDVLVARVTVDLAASRAMAPFDWDAVADWLASVGAHDAIAFAIFRRGGRHLLRVTELVRDSAGNILVDHAIGRPVSAPRVVELGIEPWPECVDRCAARRVEWTAPRDPAPGGV